jgi:glucose/arabinose dehydrogenase
MSRPGSASTARARSSPRTDRCRRTGAGLAILPILALLALVGCGGGESEATDSTQPPGQLGSTDPADAGAGEPSPEPEPALGDGRGGVALEQIGSFSAPLYVTQPPGEDEALYVVEQGGRIIRVAGDGSTSTFLDISDEISSGGERGLLSLAFAPGFERSGLLYVDFTDPGGDSRVVEYRSEDGREVDASSGRELLRIEQPFSNHNGGLLKFGPEGLLYIGTGDGGSANDPQRNALDLESLLGKLLRIDPGRSGGEPYAIPPANPFADGGGRGEIYSYGLRNPWRYSFDREGGALSIGDVGQNAREEVDLVPRGAGAGANFGWSAFEADREFNSDQQAADAVPPVLAYPTSGGNCSVTGGYVVRDVELPSLYGRYLYGDFCLGQLRSFAARPGRPARGDRELGLQVPNLSSFGEDGAGRIYVTSLDGPVYRLVPESTG